MAPDHEYPSHLELKLTATDSQGLSASTSVFLYPQTVTLNFATNPTGLQLSHNSFSGPAPFSNDVMIGSQNSISAPSPQVLGGSSYEFVSWSDGGAASHNVIAPDTPPTYTATFVLQPPPSGLSASPSTVVGGNPSTGTVVLSGPAPPSGAVVALTSSNSPLASVPPSVTVAGGATSADFQITTAAVSTDTGVTLSAFYGGGSKTAVLTVTGSNVPPSVAITSPAPGATFTAPASVLIQASASDTDGTITKVEFYSGATLLGSATSAPYTYTWSNVPAGNYSLTAVATDDDQATTTSGPVAITVNAPNVPPSVAITNPVPGAVLTEPASLTIDASASDTDGAVTQVDFYQGTTLLGSDTSAPYSFAWNNVGAGNYSLTAVATDNSGATTTSGPSRDHREQPRRPSRALARPGRRRGGTPGQRDL